MSDQEENNKIINKVIRNEWTQILTVIIAVCGMFFWSFSLTNASVEAIRQDIKDFHGRLERQDAEFKCGMLLMEEKIRSRT